MHLYYLKLKDRSFLLTYFINNINGNLFLSVTSGVFHQSQSYAPTKIQLNVYVPNKPPHSHLLSPTSVCLFFSSFSLFLFFFSYPLVCDDAPLFPSFSPLFSLILLYLYITYSPFLSAFVSFTFFWLPSPFDPPWLLYSFCHGRANTPQHRSYLCHYMGLSTIRISVLTRKGTVMRGRLDQT